MPRKIAETPPSKPLPKLTISREEATNQINNRIEKANDLLAIAINSEEILKSTRNQYYTWNDYNAELLRRIFTNEAIAEEYSESSAIIFGGLDSLRERIDDLHEDIERKIRRLNPSASE